MSNQTETIRDVKATLFKDGARPIYLLADGRFAIHWGGKWEVKQSLKSVEKIARLEKPFVRIMTCISSTVSRSSDLQSLAAAEWNDAGKVIDKDGKRHSASWRNWYLFNQNAYDELVAIEKLRAQYEREIERRVEGVRKKLKHVHCHNFKDHLPAPKASEG